MERFLGAWKVAGGRGRFHRVYHLSKVFGRTPEGWLKLQFQYDWGKSGQKIDLRNLKPIKVAQVFDNTALTF
jgi:plasmid maintenance system antidote protein VapI